MQTTKPIPRSRTIPSGAFDIALALSSSILDRPRGYSIGWHYEDGLIAMAIDAAGKTLARPDFCERALSAAAALVDADGSIKGYREKDYNLDQINPGRNLFRLLDISDDKRYVKAILALRGQLERQPRCPSGGFWHKLVYPNQMWLDGLYMAEPFLAQFASRFVRHEDFDEVVRQFTLMEKAATDPATGFLRHAWDESKSMPWSDRETGRSPHAWGRAMGWYMMALIDSFEMFPEKHPGRMILSAIMARVASPVIAAQDGESGLWWQVMDQADRAGNYLEASASSMFAYSLAKASRLGMIPSEPAAKAAREAFEGIKRRFLSLDPDGSLHLEETCAVAGLGGVPYRDGSFEYYVSEPRKRDDNKGLGPCILAALEQGAAS